MLTKKMKLVINGEVKNSVCEKVSDLLNALKLDGDSIAMLLGFGLAKLGAIAIAAAGYSFLKPYFPWWLILGCLAFSFFIGAASGFFPARAASKLKPVDALRYE